jgi:hypothetical protein
MLGEAPAVIGQGCSYRRELGEKQADSASRLMRRLC